ncbi:hypothetical protein Tco_0560026 [Tanacetum coccineum]
MIFKKDSEIVKAKVEKKSIVSKAKKKSSDEECSTSGNEDEEYAMATQKESVLVVRVQRNNDPGPSNSLGFFRSHPSRRIKLGELWDCQLGNLTAGKDSGGGGK